MADTKVSALTAQTGPNLVGTDLLYMVDIGASPESRKVTYQEFFNGIETALTTNLAAADIAGGDLLVVADASANVAKNVTMTDLWTSWPVVITTAYDGAGAVGAEDELLISDNGVAKATTLIDLIQAVMTLGVTLADVPEYADQAAAATGLSGTGRFWRQTTTGLVGITIT